MPPRGYRKGANDTKEPRPHVIKGRLSRAVYEALKAEAADRCLTFSKLIGAVLSAHATKRRAELPHAKGPSMEAIRELCRIGNNLNQVSHQANLMRLHLLEAEAKNALRAVLEAVRRLG